MTSWEDRWRELLGDVPDSAARAVVEGRGYQRSGRVTDLRVQAGTASGRVQGKRATPQLVDIVVPTLDEAEWHTVVGVLAGQLRHSARLLAGLAPEALEGELAASGVALFPAPEAVTASCGCGEAVSPCAHVAAVWEATAEAIAADPFAWLRLRGRGRERLLADLAAARGRDTDGAAAGLTLDELAADGWRSARVPLSEIHIPPGEPPATTAAPLRLLGDPPGWPSGPDAWRLFSPLVAAAAAWMADLDESSAAE